MRFSIEARGSNPAELRADAERQLKEFSPDAVVKSAEWSDAKPYYYSFTDGSAVAAYYSADVTYELIGV